MLGGGVGVRSAVGACGLEMASSAWLWNRRSRPSNIGRGHVIGMRGTTGDCSGMVFRAAGLGFVGGWAATGDGSP